jgi:hypothetical protein
MDRLVKTVGNWGVFVYFVAVLLAVSLVFAITAVPSNSALFPDPSPEDLVRGVQWAWKGAFEGPPMSRTLNER